MFRLIDKSVFIESPKVGTAVFGGCYHVKPEGSELVSMHSYMSMSDTKDMAFLRFSPDNGRSWSEAKPWPTKFEADGGVGRRHEGGCYVDPKSGKLLRVWSESVLPNDEPLEGMSQWKLHYSVSQDGGVSEQVNSQVICAGEEFDETHPMPGVEVGNNCAMMGDLGQVPLTRSDGVVLVPVQSSIQGEDGKWQNPGKGLTYTDCLLLMGRWQKDGSLSWSCSERVCADPQKTTRGLIEPTIAELEDGSLIMIMRGSNDAQPELLGCKWQSRSRDGGMSWSEPEPWRDTQGEVPYSPSACSQLLPWKDGRLFWVGNVCEANPVGNQPRYPLIICEVDVESGLMIRESLTIIDNREADEHERTTCSNFYAREDRESGDILVYLPRLFTKSFKQADSWTADLTQLRVEVK